MYTVGDRLVFLWRKPYKGTTPGTIKDIKINKKTKTTTVTVSWDDDTVTNTSIEFLKERTILLNKDKVH